MPEAVRTVAALLLVGSLLGCGEPVIATVGLLRGDRGGDGGPSADEDSGQDEDGDVVDRSDAQVGPRDSGADAAVFYDAGPLATGTCISLYDVSAEAGRIRQTGLIEGRTVQNAGCKVFDMADKTTSSIYSRKDGKPILLEGVAYSFRWPQALTLLTRIRLFGGDEVCSVGKILDVAPPTFNPYVAAPGCAEFTTEFEVSFLRFPQESWNLNAGVPTELCAEACPAPAMMP